MNRNFCFAFALSLTALSGFAQTTLFDSDWRFHRGGAQGSEMPSVDDNAWRVVDLPHDWSIEDLPGTSSPFDRDAVGQVSSGFTTGGTGWYRKTFNVPADQKGKRIIIQFDGVYMNADVWINGEPLGDHPYGYTSFWYDLTDKLKFGAQNLIAVQVKNEGQTSRWYSGSGIYRHVWLKVLNNVHVAQWGTFVTTPEVSAAAARVNVKTNVVNESSAASTVTLRTRVVDAAGVEKAKAESQQTLAAGASYEFNQDAQVSSPKLWSLETPVLYQAITDVMVNGKVVDTQSSSFGIRTISFDAKNGFQLNGQSLEIKGGCVHHDNGPLGSRAYDRAETRRVELLKASGYNAIRCAHNPPSPAFLDACDRLGMLVIDEAFDMWVNPNNPHDYHLYFEKWWQRDLESMLYRDRNHPSIILWSIGNEIRGMETPEVVDVAHRLADHVRKIDTSRPVTAAVNAVNEKKDPFFSALDVKGYNYARGQYVPDHQRVPDRVMFCTESYPLEAFEYWTEAKQHAWVIGDFVWTSFDHIGEASIGWRGYPQENDFYPWSLAFTGDIDICGWKRPQSYYRDALWGNGNNVSIFVTPPTPSFPVNPKREYWSIWHWHDVVADWNWPGRETQPLNVVVYSSCDKVELFLNGKSLGKKETTMATKYTATWPVPYQPGTLTAVGYKGSKKVTETQLGTAGAPASIRMTADRTQIAANGQDLSYVTVELLDDKGIRNPKAEDLVEFSISGPATIVAVGNANPVSLESFQQPRRKAWKGRCLVIVKSTGEPGQVKLKASVQGLQSQEVTLNTVK